MRDKQYKRFRIIHCSILLAGALIAFCVFGFFIGNQYLKNNRSRIEAEIKTKFGFPVVFEELRLSWSGFSFGVALKNVLINDSEMPVPFLSIATLRVFPSVKDLIFDKKIQFQKIQIEDLRAIVAWDKKNGLSLLGLNGEYLPTVVNYSDFVNFVRENDGIEIEDSHIEWRLDNFRFNQFLTGKFSFISELEKFSLQIGHSNQKAYCDFIEAKKEDIKDWKVFCEAKVEEVNVSKIHEFYQEGKGYPEWITWLNHALVAGEIIEGSMKVGYANGELNWAGNVEYEGVEFIYTQGWPMINNAKGKVQFNSKNVSIQLNEGNILGANISPVSILVAQLDGHHPFVQVQGSAESDLETGVLFLEKSPLKNMIAEQLIPLDLTGPIELDLKLTIPLIDKTQIKVDGLLSTKQAKLKIPETSLFLSSIEGQCHFTENFLEGKNIKGSLLEKNFNISINTKKRSQENYVEITAVGLLGADFLQKKIPFSIPFFDKLRGASLFSIGVEMPFGTSSTRKKKVEWRISSDLQGMEVLLPGFMGKKAEEKQMIVVGMAHENEKNRIHFYAEKLVDAKLIFGPKRALNQGNIVFGAGGASWPSKPQLSVRGEIGSLNVNDWLSFFDSNKLNTNNWFSIFDFQVFMNQLEYEDLKLNNVKVSTQFPKNPFVLELEGDSVKGRIHFEKASAEKMFIELDYLKFNLNEKRKQIFFSSKLRKEIVFRCKYVQFQEKDLGGISFDLIPKTFGYEIKTFIMENNFSELLGCGEWHFGGQSDQTQLKGVLKTKNITDSLKKLGYGTAIRDAIGHIDYELKWNGNPFQAKLETLEGNVEVRLDKGRILGLSPGIGRIMGLLSLESIHRRLRLDFSDFLKKGFAFDTLKGQFKFAKGFAQTESLNIESPSAKIQLTGQANLMNKQIDLTMFVTSRITSTGFPVAAAIAGGPVAGAGAFIFDWLTGSKIDKINQHRYELTGTWDAPAIQEPLPRSKKHAE